MKTRDFTFAVLTMVCAFVVTNLFTACSSSSSDEDSIKAFSYTIYVEPVTYIWEDGNPDLMEWLNSIKSAYETALGVSSDSFSKTGKEAECNKAVQDDCKKAESTVANIKGGTANVMVKNNTSGKTVYSYKVLP